MNKKEYEREAGFAVKFALAGLVGFVIDAGLLHLGLTLGLSPALGRAISIVSAMQVTFLINGLAIFKCLTMRNCAKHWAAYMLTSGFGNFCSYMIFITLTSLHWQRAFQGVARLPRVDLRGLSDQFRRRPVPGVRRVGSREAGP